MERARNGEMCEMILRVAREDVRCICTMEWTSRGAIRAFPQTKKFDAEHVELAHSQRSRVMASATRRSEVDQKTD